MSQTQLETQNQKLETDLCELAQDIVRRAMSGGATAAECVIREGDEFSTVVRLGQVETLKESGSKAIGLRVFYGQRAASTYSSDFSRAGLDRMLKSALELAKITSEDPFGEYRSPLNWDRLPATSISTLRMFIPSLEKNASAMPGVQRRLRSTTILASRIPRVVRSKPRPDTKFWQTRMDSSANTSVRIVPSRRCPLRNRTMAPSNVITGFRSPVA